MKWLLVTGFLFFSSFSNWAQADTTKSDSIIRGVYQGKVRGGEPGETIFYTNTDGDLVGMYFTHSGYFTSQGELVDLKLCCGGIVIGKWQEFDASGQVVFNFQDSLFSQFTGTWGDLTSSENGGQWEGRKLQAK